MRVPTFFSRLREASFRGVPFEVDDVEASGGRRVVLHEYPLRDTPYREDLGRRAREFSVRGYIIQGRTYDYATSRANLLKALEAYGAGELVHPWHGEVSVVVDDYRLREVEHITSPEALLVDCMVRSDCTAKDAIKMLLKDENNTYSKNELYAAHLALKERFGA